MMLPFFFDDFIKAFKKNCQSAKNFVQNWLQKLLFEIRLKKVEREIEKKLNNACLKMLRLSTFQGLVVSANLTKQHIYHANYVYFWTFPYSFRYLKHFLFVLFCCLRGGIYISVESDRF